jgi:uncharacterized protein (DUF433 family)
MLGKGVYQLGEVTRYAGVPASTLRSWFKWRSDREGNGPIFKSDYEAVGRDFAVSFLDLIDAYVARFFRNAGVQPRLIRRAYQILGDELRTKHPFAHTDLCTDGSRIIRKQAEKGLTDVVSRQTWFAEMRDWLKHIDYDPETRLAARWCISGGVVIDPAISFGKPVVCGTGITTFVLAQQYFANSENAGLVADLYGVAEDDVMNAVTFEANHNLHRVKSRRAA